MIKLNLYEYLGDSSSFDSRILNISSSISSIIKSTGSYILSSQTSSMTVLSSSYTNTASYYGGSVISASYAETASYVTNASSFPYTGSALITGSLGVTGSVSILAYTSSADSIFKVQNSSNTYTLCEIAGDGGFTYKTNTNALGLNQDANGNIGIGSYANANQGFSQTKEGNVYGSYFGGSTAQGTVYIARSGVGGYGLVVLNSSTAGFCQGADIRANGTSLVNWALTLEAANATGGAGTNLALKLVAGDLSFENASGHRIGITTSQKLSFWNATPIVQPSAVTSSQGIADALTSIGLISASSVIADPVSASYSVTSSYALTAQTLLGSVVSASYASTASHVTLAQTASYVVTSQTASYVVTAQTASYVLNAVSASYAATASFHTQTFSKGGTVFNANGITNNASYMVWRASFACTVTKVYAYREGGSATQINVLKNTSLLTGSNYSIASTNSWLDIGALQNTSVASGDALMIVVSGSGASPTEISVQIDLNR